MGEAIFDAERFDLHLAAERERLASEGHLQLAPTMDTAQSRMEAARQAMHDAVQQERRKAQAARDDATKTHGRFVAKLANSRPADPNSYQDVPHPNGNGASVRVYGNGQQAAQDSAGHFAYHDTLDSAAKAAARDDAKSRYFLGQDEPFDYRAFRLALDAASDADPDDDGDDDYLEVLHAIQQDAQQYLDRLNAAKTVSPEVLKAAQLAVQSINQRIDAYKSKPDSGRVNDNV